MRYIITAIRLLIGGAAVGFFFAMIWVYLAMIAVLMGY